MAKKKNRKNKQLTKMLSLVTVIFGILAIAMLFLPAIAVKNTDTTYNAFDVIFGYKEKGTFTEVTIFEFSIYNLLALVFVAVGTVLAILRLSGSKSKIFGFVTAVLFVLAGVLFFLTIEACVPNENASSIIGLLGGNIKDSFTLGIGAILGAIFSLLAGIVELAKTFTK